MVTNLELNHRVDKLEKAVVKAHQLMNRTLDLLENAELAPIPKQPNPNNNDSVLFYPAVEDEFYLVKPLPSGDGYIVSVEIRIPEENSYDFPKIRTEEAAEKIAWARGEADKWRAMGVMPKEGQEVYTVTPSGRPYKSDQDLDHQAMEDALFLTIEDAIKALEEFGGIEHLNKVRRGLWGIE